MVKVINQVKSSPSSVQAKITCVNENAEVVTSMDTSPQYTSMKNSWFNVNIVDDIVDEVKHP